MVIELDFASDTPIYVQLRNQIVKGIGKGELKAGEKLPTVRQLASADSSSSSDSSFSLNSISILIFSATNAPSLLSVLIKPSALRIW